MKSYGGHFQADGGAYDLVIPFRPDVLKLWNYTQFGVDGGVGLATWFRTMPAGDALEMVHIDNDAGSDRTSLVLETTNGFTDNFDLNVDSTGFAAYTTGGVATRIGEEIPIEDVGGGTGFVDQHVTITGATQADPAVLTVVAHGWGAAGVTGRLTVEKMAVGGMVTMNGRTYNYTVLTADTVSLQDITGPEEWKITLGSGVYGSNDDSIYFETYQLEQYVELGDIA